MSISHEDLLEKIERQGDRADEFQIRVFRAIALAALAMLLSVVVGTWTAASMYYGIIGRLDLIERHQGLLSGSNASKERPQHMGG